MESRPCGEPESGGSRPPAERDAHAIEERVARQGDEHYLNTRRDRAVLLVPVRTSHSHKGQRGSLGCEKEDPAEAGNR